ncbi:unnamed protein product, partial [Ectocarpus fasciculatus]
MSTSASISKGDGSTENTPLGIWALLKFAALLSATACFLLRVVKKAAGSAIGLIIGPPGPTPPLPTPPGPNTQPEPWRPVVQRPKTEAMKIVNNRAEARAQRVQNGGRY